MADELKLKGAPLEGYDPELRAFFKFWYGHMLGDMMQPPLADIDHATARYIWDAARRAAPAAAQLGADLPPPNVYEPYGQEPTAYSVNTVRKIIAQYAERIRLLERELAERVQKTEKGQN